MRKQLYICDHADVCSGSEAICEHIVPHEPSAEFYTEASDVEEFCHEIKVECANLPDGELVVCIPYHSE